MVTQTEQGERVSRRGRRKSTGEPYEERLVIKMTRSQMKIVEALVAREAFCPPSTYVRRMLLARAAEVLGKNGEVP